MNPAEKAWPRSQDDTGISDLQLDRYMLGEIESAAERRAVEMYIATHPECQQRVANWGKEWESLGRDTQQRSLDAVLKAVQGHRPRADAPHEAIDQNAAGQDSGTKAWFPALAAKPWVWTLLPATCIVLLAVWQPWQSSLSPLDTPQPGVETGANPPEEVRIKGQRLGFAVFRSRQGTVQQVNSGDDFYPGDKLRFSVHAPFAGFVMVVGVDSTNGLYPCYPIQPPYRAQTIDAGQAGHLPGAIELDAAQGQERLHMVICPHPFELDDLKGNMRTLNLQTPEGCVATAFDLHKTDDA